MHTLHLEHKDIARLKTALSDELEVEPKANEVFRRLGQQGLTKILTE